MQPGILEFEGKCLILLEQTESISKFFTDGANIRCVISNLPQIDDIVIDEILIEIEEGQEYRCFGNSDFIRMTSLQQIKDLISLLNPDYFLYKLSISHKEFQLNIYDNRDVTFEINHDAEKISFDEIVSNIFSACLKINSTVLNLIKKDYQKQYVEIDQSGNILNTYKNFDEYSNKLNSKK
jgi:hypothetical protein